MNKIKLTALIYIIAFFMINTETKAAGTPQISYTVTFPEAQAHYAAIEMKITGLQKNVLDLKMPVWTPGSYLVREFAKNIESLNASTGSKDLSAQKINKNTWRIQTAGISSVTVKYKVYAFENSVRTSLIDATHAFLSTSGLFLYPAGGIDQPSTIHIKPLKEWTKVSTSLEKVNGDAFTLHAPNYDILFDSPIEVGYQDVFGFDVDDVKYEVAMYGGGNYDKEKLSKDITTIVKEEAAVYGENPNKYYVFIVHNYARGGGGLEHLSSTVLGASRDQYSTERGYQGFLSLVAHEHFHLWNVKRLRPIALGPFDYENENYTTNLWIAEGFTAYYQDIMVRRTNLYPPENYLNVLANNINTVENQPGNKVQTLSESSFDAWIKLYRPNENSYNTTISYYNKGSIMALLLDLDIIHSSNGKYSLDDVMKYMYTQYYKLKKRGYTDQEFKQGFEKFAGHNYDDFYKNYINGLTAINYNKYLGYAGYKLVDELEGNNDPALGVNTSKVNGKLMVTTVIRNGSAWVAGLSVNDEITAIDGKPLPENGNLLEGKKFGDKVVVTVNRDGVPTAITVELQKKNEVKYKVESLSSPDESQLAVRKKWLKL